MLFYVSYLLKVSYTFKCSLMLFSKLVGLVVQFLTSGIIAVILGYASTVNLPSSSHCAVPGEFPPSV